MNAVKWILKLKDNYKNLKIFNKLILTYLFLLGIVCSASLLSLQVTLNIYDEQLYLKSVQVLNFFAVSMENDFKRIEKLSLDSALDSNIQNQLSYIKNSTSKYDRLKEASALKDKILAQSVSEKNLSGIAFKDALGSEFSVGKNPPLINKDLEDEIIEKANNQNGGCAFIEPNINYEYLIFGREILEYQNLSLEHLGTLIFSCDLKDIVNQNFNVLQNDATQLYIFSGNKLIYANDSKVDIDDINFELNNEQGYSVCNYKGKKVFLSYTTSSYMKWTYVSILPYDKFYSNNIKVRNILIIVFTFLFLSTIYFSYRIARNITVPIEDLTASMKQVENGNFQNVIIDLPDYNRTDEVGYLQKDFLIMVNKINDLIKENYEKQILIKDTQFNALQAQVNPHFLYNTLSSISWMSKKGRNEDTIKMVMSLANILRSSLNKEAIITINEEVQLLESYINIQKIRYEDRALFVVAIDESHKKYHIPRMSLQPLVENSINYGVENMLDLCTIKISSQEVGENLEISIYDNGPGIEPELLEGLKKFEIIPKGNGVGMKNIDDRLKLLFGEKYGLRIESEPDKGTNITIVIPKR